MKQIRSLMMLLCFMILVGCTSEASEKVLTYQENNEIIGEERDELIGEVSPTIYETIDRGNDEAEEILVNPIERPGVTVTPKPGRYLIHTGEPGRVPQGGRIVIHDENDTVLLEEVIEYYYGVDHVTVSLNGSHSVYIDGLDWLYFTPIPTEVSNELSAGIWEVGVDIDPGNYTVTAEGDWEFGYLQIFEEGKEPRVFEILNNPTYSTIDIELEEGQILKISGVLNLKFE